MKLIDNWRKAPRMISVVMMALSGAILQAWPLIPEDLKAALPPDSLRWLVSLLLVAGIVGRLLKQDSVQPKD